LFAIITRNKSGKQGLRGSTVGLLGDPKTLSILRIVKSALPSAVLTEKNTTKNYGSGLSADYYIEVKFYIANEKRTKMSYVKRLRRNHLSATDFK
jgi:hypothetical protein